MRWAGGAGKPLPHYGKTAVCAASAAWGKLLLHMKKRRSSPLFERKPAVFRQKKALTAPLRDASAHTPAIIHNEEAPLCWDPLPCNSTALAPQGFRPTFATYLLRSTLPMADFRPHSLRCFGRILALTVPSAVGFSPKFLQNCRLTQSVFTACSHTTSPDPIKLSSFYLMGKSTGSQKFCFADVLLSLSAISIKRRRFVVNSHLQNLSFLTVGVTMMCDKQKKG